MNVDTQTKAKLREMGAAELVRSLEAQDDSVCMGMAFADRLQAAVDEAYSQFVTDKVSGLTKRAKLRYPEADIRKLELVEERKLNRVLVAELASCGFMVFLIAFIFRKSRDKSFGFHGSCFAF